MDPNRWSYFKHLIRWIHSLCYTCLSLKLCYLPQYSGKHFVRICSQRENYVCSSLGQIIAISNILLLFSNVPPPVFTSTFLKFIFLCLPAIFQHLLLCWICFQKKFLFCFFINSDISYRQSLFYWYRTKL